jgi:hypothetical protein
MGVTRESVRSLRSNTNMSNIEFCGERREDRDVVGKSTGVILGLG